MTICSFCGNQNESGIAFCGKCKTDLSVPAPMLSRVVEMSSSGSRLVALPPLSGDIDNTLHFEKIPLVESLGSGTDEAGELTRLAASRREGVISGSISVPSPANSPLEAIPQALKPSLISIRGEKLDMRYPIYLGKNYLGRTDEKPVDIDLENQEPADRIWTSRQHAVINFENGVLTIEDLNSLNGTFVNRTRVHPGQLRTLQANDIVQVGTVQMRVVIS